MDQQPLTFQPTDGMIKAGIEAARDCPGSAETVVRDVFLAMLRAWCSEIELLFAKVENNTKQ